MVLRKQVEQRVAAFLCACRRNGVRVTRQRPEILRELARTDEHPDAEMLYRRVRRRIPAMPLGTLYRTLRMPEGSGVISRVGSVRDRARFDANTERHHHFVCSECGLIGDFQSEGFDALVVPAEVEATGTVSSVPVELRGLCGECRARGRGPKVNGQAGEQRKE